MKTLNTYILEKFQITKDSKVSEPLSLEKIMNHLNGYLKDELGYKDSDYILVYNKKNTLILWFNTEYLRKETDIDDIINYVKSLNYKVTGNSEISPGRFGTKSYYKIDFIEKQ